MVVNEALEEWKRTASREYSQSKSPLVVKDDFHRIYLNLKEEISRNLENLDDSQRNFYLDRLRKVFSDASQGLYDFTEEINKYLEVEGVSLDDLISGEDYTLTALLDFEGKMGLNELKYFKERHYDAVRIRNVFFEFFKFQAVQSMISFVNNIVNPNSPESYPQIKVEKIQTQLNAEELAIFFRVLRESGIIDSEISVNKLFEIVANHFVSKKGESNSSKSLSKKYYSSNDIAYRNVAVFISTMDKTIESLINEVDK